MKKSLLKKMSAVFPAFVFTSLALTLSSCAMEQPVAAVSRSTYTQVTREEQQLLPSDIKMLTLEQAQAIALKNNPGFKKSQLAVKSAQAQYYKSYAGYMPTASFNYSMSQSHSYAHNIAAGDNTRRWNSSPGFTFNMMVFDSFQREFNLLASYHTSLESAAAEQDARRLLLRTVAYAYNNVLLAQAQCRIAADNMRYNYELLKETELKFEAGASPLSDVLNFKVNYNAAESSLYSAQYAEISAKFALAALLGLTEGAIPEDVAFPEMPSPDGEMLADINFYLDEALKNRPDLIQFREALETSKYNYYSSIAAFGPTMNAYLDLGYNTSVNRSRGKWGGKSSISRPRSHSIGYGFSISWELFSGGRTYFNMVSAQAGMEAARFDVANTWITVITDVRTAYENYRTSLKQVKLNQKNLELVRKQRDLVNQEYNAGSTGITRVNEAQNAFVSAESALASAVINMHNAKSQLQAATNSL